MTSIKHPLFCKYNKNIGYKLKVMGGSKLKYASRLANLE
jgi:hypothetical protein